MVDDWSIEVNICDRKSLTRGEVTEKICLMSEKLAEKLRIEIIKLRQMLNNASAKDGSSEKNLYQYITHLKVKVNKRIE